MSIPAKQSTIAEKIEAALIKGDLAPLTTEERVVHYNQVCESLGLNPRTQPFGYIELNRKLVLYPLRTCTDQLRKLNGISLQIVSQEISNGLLTVHVRATDKSGRTDEDIGAVPFNDKLIGEARSNTVMKAITKAKRRTTLSISGLGWPDESEVDSIPDARKPPEPAPNVLKPPEPKPEPKQEVLPPATQALSSPAIVGTEEWKRLDHQLATAAEHGTEVLLIAWDALTHEQKKAMQAAKDRRYKPRAMQIDAKEATDEEDQGEGEEQEGDTIPF